MDVEKVNYEGVDRVMRVQELSLSPIRIAAIVGAVFLGIVLFMVTHPLQMGMPLAPADTVVLNGVEYHQRVVDIPSCTGDPGSETPTVDVDVGDFSYSMRIQSCFSPAGPILNGSCSHAGEPAMNFLLSSRQVPDENGYISWFSSDGRAGVQWGGSYRVWALVRS